MIADLKPHQAVKDSGVEWLGKVPEHWEVRRAKYIFSCVDVRSKKGDEELLTVSSVNGVVPRKSMNVTMFKAESYVNYKLCWPGDLVINSLWAWGYGLGVSRDHGIVSTAYGVYRRQVGVQINMDYFHMLVRSTSYHWELRVRSKGVWISRLQLTDESFLRSELPLPPTSEQTAIVRYLDYVEQRVRRLVRAKQKLIELLKEQKQTIIHHAVTRGLDPNVPLKDSGVEWLGEVPKHWKIQRLKAGVANIVDQTTNKNTQNLYIALEHVESWTGIIRKSGADTVFDSQVKRFIRGDVLFGKLRPYLAKVTCPDCNGVCVGEFLVLRPKDSKLVASYLEHFLRSKPAIDIVNAATFGAKMPRADWTFIGNLEQLVPPVAEQILIVKYLDKSTADIDSAISRARREIELLQEYRTRLIADVVTGKVDVRGVANSLPDEFGDSEPTGERNALSDIDEETERMERLEG